MPFGLSTSSEEFQRRQAEALEGIPGTISIVDDVLIFGKDDTIDEAIRDHDRNLIAVMERAQERIWFLTRQRYDCVFLELHIVDTSFPQKGSHQIQKR